LLDALIPLIFMIAVLTWSIILFGIDAAADPVDDFLIQGRVNRVARYEVGANDVEQSIRFQRCSAS
jgi:hypothetical protein